MADTYDILIIGAGPGGYVAAIRAAQLGFKTAVVDREHLGGICLNWGCIPTKALLRSAEIYHYMQHASDYGLSAEKVGFDTAAIVKRSRGVSTRLNGGVGMLLKKNKVDVIWGEATVTAAAKGNQPGQVTVKETTRAPAPKGPWRPAPIPPSTSSWRPGPGPARSRASSRIKSRSGPITRPWCRRRCPKASS